jgi:predicted Fe-Mo cluster-binding NifX family protein
LPMRLAIPTLADRISPVFDVARQLLVVDVDHGEAVDTRNMPLEDGKPAARARHLATLGVTVLICGAVSRPLERLLLSEGLEVFSQRCGPVGEVLSAFLSGRLTEEAFRMPGCFRHPPSGRPR